MSSHAQESTPPTAIGAGSPGRRLDIQGLRAVAVLMVVAYHAGLYVPGGFVGVDVFFVISGFVITAMLAREWEKHGRIRLARFYLRRFKRLTPALALTVSVTILASTLLLSPLGPQQNAAHTGLGALLLSANIVIARTTGGYFDAPAESNPLLNMWSLSVEEQFYLFFPIVLVLSWAVSRRWRIVRVPAMVVVAIGVASFALAVIGSSGFSAPSSWMLALLNVLLGFYSPLTRAWEFAAGALLALAASKLAVIPGRLAAVSGMAGAMGLTASLWVITGSTPFPGVWTLLPVVATVLLLVAGTGGPNMVSRALSVPLMTKIGDWSYSLYLWHWPFIVFARILFPDSAPALVVAAALSMGPAYASYRWVEEPIRAMDIASLGHLARIVLATLVPPLALIGGLLYAAGQGFWSADVQMYQAAALSRHAGDRAGCDSFLPLGAEPVSECTWNATADQGPPLYLLGDSNADHFSEAAIDAGAVLGRPVIISTTSNCPFVEGHLDRTDASQAANDRCRMHVTGTLEYLRGTAPGTVILAATDLYWTNPTVVFGVDEATATPTTREKLAALDVAMESTVRSLQASGHRVILVQTMPHWTGPYAWDPASCSLAEMFAGGEACDSQMPLEFARSQQRGPRDVLAGVTARTGAHLIDPGLAMCPGGVCSVRATDFIRLNDSVHISVDQSEALAPMFAETVLLASEPLR